LLISSFVPRGVERNGAVYDKIARSAVLVDAEVALTHELECVARLCVAESALEQASVDNFERIGVDVLEIVAVSVLACGVLGVEQAVIEAHLSLHVVRRADPVQGAANLSAVGRFAAAALGIVGAVQAGDFAVFIGII